MGTFNNNVRLVGFLGANPEVKQVSESKSVLRVSLATNDRFRDAEGEWITDTQWHQLVFWGQKAEKAGKNLKKGQEIAIEGRLIHRSYTDKDGHTKYVTEISVYEWLLIQKKE